MKKNQKQQSSFWKAVAKAEVSLQNKIAREFARHEEVIRNLLIEVRVSPASLCEYRKSGKENWSCVRPRGHRGEHSPFVFLT